MIQTADSTPGRQPPLRLILLAAATQGIALWFLAGAREDAAWPDAYPGIYVALLTLAIFLAPTLYALAEWARRWQAWMAIGVAALVLATVGVHNGAASGRPGGHVYDGPVPDFEHFLVTFVLMFHAVPFVQCALAEGRWQWRYERLFEFAWRNALRLALAGLFSGVTWLLLWTAAKLFEMIGIDFLMIVLFDEGRFFWLPLTLAFGAGVYFAENSERLMHAARSLLLSLLKWLAAAAALIMVLFSLALLLKAPELFASNQRVISATWLLWLAALNIYLYNAGFQDGSDAQPYPPLLGRLLRYATPLLLLVCILAAYALIIRVLHYGLTVPRVWGLLVAGIALLYAAGYVLAARRATPWMAGIGRVNTLIAAVLMVVLTLMLTPPLSPQRLTAASLQSRLLARAGAVDIDSLRILRNDSGRYGLDRLRELAQGEDRKVPDALRIAAAAALESKSGLVEFARAPETVFLEALPAGSAQDESLRTAVANWPDARDDLGVCIEQSPCIALIIDTDADGISEALVFTPKHLALFHASEGSWIRDIATTRTCFGIKSCDIERDIERVRAGDYELVEKRFTYIRIGKRTYPVGKD